MKKTLVALAVLLVAGTPVTSHAQLGRLRGKPDSAKMAADSAKKAAEDSTKKANGETPAAPKQGRFGGLMNKVMTKVVQAGVSSMGDANVVPTADLTTVIPLVSRASKIYGKELGTVETNLLKNWGSGGDVVSITFTSKTGVMSKIDGTVTVDGVPMDYQFAGTYTSMVPNTPKARTVEITTTTGQKSTFTIPAPKAQDLKIAAINGSKGSPAVDLSKDITIDLEGLIPGDTTPLNIKILATTVGLRGLYDVFSVKPAPRITISAASLRNINLGVGSTNLAGFGNSYVLVSREEYVDVQNGTGELGKSQALVSINDGRAITTTAEPSMNKGINVKGKQDFTLGEMKWDLFKGHAYASRPISQIKTIGITSFVLRGTTFFEKVTQSEDSKAIYTKTVTVTFPQLPDAMWDKALDNLYASLLPVIEEELSARVLPIDKVTKAPEYAVISPFSAEEANTTVNFARAYKDTKILSAFMPLGMGYGPNRSDDRLMAQTGANALMKVTLDVQLTDKEGGSMTPILGFEIVGAPNGRSASTKFFTGRITGKGFSIVGKPITQEFLDSIIRTSDLATALRAALKEMKAKEAANPDYEFLWKGR